VFQRFGERARQAVVLAQDESRILRHHYLGTEHLLLGLLREEQGPAAAVLASLGVELAGARAKVAEIVGTGDRVTRGQIPFTPRAKKALELALREALALGHTSIGTEHILLALVHESDGVAARILLDLGADAATVREATMRLLSQPRRHAPSLPPPAAARAAGTVVLRQPRWQYRIEVWADGVAERRERLALLGEEGWQLAAVLPSGEAFEWVFQRPKARRRPGGPA
jgi:ATP-dependent Clp protease ATP-binding subunit ClpC